MRAFILAAGIVAGIDAFTHYSSSSWHLRRQNVVRQAEDDTSPKWLKKLSKGLASLSLKDAAWRSSLTKASQDDGLDISAYEGDPEGPASKAVKLLQGVVEAETSRAEQIVAGGGSVVRPKDAPIPGLLGKAERDAILALENLVAAEQERARGGEDAGAAAGKGGRKVLLRPKDASRPEMLGLLGELEKDTVRALEQLAASERKRVQEAGGNLLAPPLNLPPGERSILGDAEGAARSLVAAEVARLQQMLESGTFVRPMDVAALSDSSDASSNLVSPPSAPSSSSTTNDSPLGSAERAAVTFSQTVRAYELARLEQLRAKGLLPERPMDTDPDSVAGVAERIGVGVFRAPVMLGKVLARTLELLTAAEEVAEVEHAAREELELNPKAALANAKLLRQIKKGVDRAPVLTGALVTRTKELTKELLVTADDAAAKNGGLL